MPRITSKRNKRQRRLQNDLQFWKKSAIVGLKGESRALVALAKVVMCDGVKHQIIQSDPKVWDEVMQLVKENSEA